jgi:hypothetical protein
VAALDLGTSFIPMGDRSKKTSLFFSTYPFFQNFKRKFALRAFLKKSEIAHGNEARTQVERC